MCNPRRLCTGRGSPAPRLLQCLPTAKLGIMQSQAELQGYLKIAVGSRSVSQRPPVSGYASDSPTTAPPKGHHQTLVVKRGLDSMRQFNDLNHCSGKSVVGSCQGGQEGNPAAWATQGLHTLSPGFLCPGEEIPRWERRPHFTTQLLPASKLGP